MYMNFLLKMSKAPIILESRMYIYNRKKFRINIQNFQKCRKNSQYFLNILQNLRNLGHFWKRLLQEEILHTFKHSLDASFTKFLRYLEYFGEWWNKWLRNMVTGGISITCRYSERDCSTRKCTGGLSAVFTFDIVRHRNWKKYRFGQGPRSHTIAD